MSEVTIKDVGKDYVLKTSIIKQLLGKENIVSAVNKVSFTINQGEIVGLVGESGCGKTTLGKMLVQIEDITEGKVFFNKKDISFFKKKDKKSFHKSIQMIFQDPFDSLNPKMTIYDMVAEPLENLKKYKSKKDIKEKVISTLEQVNLSPAETYMSRYPHKLSGGQRQRVAIARALVVDPDFIVADEPVSMLDVSIRAGILNLLKDINRNKGVSILLITHDLATARFLCNRIAVMYLGEVKEILASDKLMETKHPYSHLLLSSVPDLFGPKRKRLEIKGEASNAVIRPKGCRFAPRCPFVEDRCVNEEQKLEIMEKNHWVACWKADQIKENLINSGGQND